MSLFDNPATIPTLSAIGGSIIGALSSTVGAWILQQHRERRELVATKLAQLEQLYSEFINESARLLVDAVQHSLETPGTLQTKFGPPRTGTAITYRNSARCAGASSNPW